MAHDAGLTPTPYCLKPHLGIRRWRQDEDGKEFGFYGDYREVDAPGRMVQAEYYDPGSFGGAMPTGSIIIRKLSRRRTA